MGVVIDSCLLIAAERGRLDLGAIGRAHTGEALFMSAISASELLHGVHRATDLAEESHRLASVEATLRRFPVLVIDLAVARVHARLAADLARAGTPVPAHDLWIAATCIAHGHTLVTTNARDFERIPGLALEVWR
jgi:predicted nucleic acid-binding protein